MSVSFSTSDRTGEKTRRAQWGRCMALYSVHGVQWPGAYKTQLQWLATEFSDPAQPIDV